MDETPTDNPDSLSDDEPSQTELLTLLETLRSEHRAIDMEIRAMFETGVNDMLKIKRMKKVELAMKDKIAFLENQITPDIIA